MSVIADIFMLIYVEYMLFGQNIIIYHRSNYLIQKYLTLTPSFGAFFFQFLDISEAYTLCDDSSNVTLRFRAQIRATAKTLPGSNRYNLKNKLMGTTFYCYPKNPHKADTSCECTGTALGHPATIA